MRNATARNLFTATNPFCINIGDLHGAREERPHRSVSTREQVIEACREFALLNKFDMVKRLALAVGGEMGRYYSLVPLASPDLIDTSKIEDPYLPRVLLSIAQATIRAGSFPESERLLAEAGSLALKHGDYYTAFEAAKQKAIITSEQGGRAFALKQMESLRPLVRLAARAHRIAFAHYDNSLAIMLSEGGRVREAQAAITRALAAPHACNWSEIRQTATKIATLREPAPRRCIVVPGLVKEPAQSNVFVPYERFKSRLSGAYMQEEAKLTSRNAAIEAHKEICRKIGAFIFRGRNNLDVAAQFRRIHSELDSTPALAPELEPDAE
jgi:tetratricopeptide (TPR) repeat protein